MEDLQEAQRGYLLDDVEEIWTRIQKLDDDYRKSRDKLKKEFAEKVEEGKLEADLPRTAIAERLGVTRQTVHKMIIDTYGVRDFAKAKAGSIGHENRTNYGSTKNKQSEDK